MTIKFSGILFDMDGVLVDSMGALCQAWMAACNQVGIDADETDMYLREEEQEEKSAKYFIKKAGLMLTKARVRELLRLKDEFFANLPTAKLFPGAVDVVTAFKKAGFKVGIVTGSARVDFERMMPKEIRDALTISICGDELIHGKPNPEPYLKGIMALDLPSKKVVVIENAPYGIQSAKGAGAHIIAVRSYLGKGELTGADQFVDDIRELPKLLGISE